ncbi:peptidyl-tRNA hydrolase-like [Sycon ciliatum]|uniref:peptidyl-tRNA hydrolase-like n=1 Tax=Sycon ciliatum TaxID=27933 RepID=UPI0031F6474A|eukprot:scpid66124/ scgid4893/ Peptidyl-tRNA hydrolase
MIRRCSLRPFLSPFSSRAGQQKNSLFQSVRSVHDDSTTEVDPSAVNVVQSIDYKYIIMGLGNVDFMQARHSIGMRVAKFMAHELKGTRFIRDRPLLAQVSTVQLPNSDQILLLKSNLAMNASGKSLRKAVDKHLLSPYEVIIVYDDMELEPGEVQWKAGGGSEGHNGLRSVMASLGSDQFARVRVGIGRPHSEKEVREYVMSKAVESEERRLLTKSIFLATQMLLDRIAGNSAPKLKPKGPMF